MCLVDVVVEVLMMCECVLVGVDGVVIEVFFCELVELVLLGVFWVDVVGCYVYMNLLW